MKLMSCIIGFFTMSILLIGSPILLVAQADKDIGQAKKYISLEEYDKAKQLLENTLSKQSEHAEALYYLGISQLNLQENKAGKKNIEKAFKMNPQVDEEFGSYWKGMAYYHNYMTNEAKESFGQYKASLPEKSEMHETIDNLLKSIDAIQSQKESKTEFYIGTISGSINTKYEDHSPLLTSDEKSLIYTSRNQESTVRKEKKKGEYFENIYIVGLNDFNPKGNVENLSEVLNTNQHDASIQMFDNGSKMLIYRIDHGGDIYLSSKADGDWSNPEPLGKTINSNAFESSAFVLPDGKTMYFSSSRKSKSGSLNIYKTIIGKDGNWTEPELLGPEINSEEADEDCPFVTSDGKKLYFSSKGHNSIGGYDIFVSNWLEKENKWSEAVNLGMPVNSVGDDMYFVLDKTSTLGYFASFREGGKGGMDIYQVGKILPIVLEADITVEGNSEARVGEIKAKLKSIDYGSNYESLSDKKGSFTSSIDANSSYEVSLYSENYKDGREPFSVQTIDVPRTTKSNDKLKKNISISEADYKKLERNYQLSGGIATQDGASIDGSLEITDKASGKALISTSSKNGKFSVEFKSLSGKSYSIKLLSNGNVFENINQFETGNDYKINKDIIVTFPSGSNKDNSGVIATIDKKSGFTSSHSILFLNNSVKIATEYTNELDRIVNSIKKGSKIQILIEGYADNVGRASYNKKLSKKRAKEVEKYLVSKGLSKKMMKVEYYGEDNPVADNSTEKGRILNRRVEVHLK